MEPEELQRGGLFLLGSATSNVLETAFVSEACAAGAPPFKVAAAALYFPDAAAFYAIRPTLHACPWLPEAARRKAAEPPSVEVAGKALPCSLAFASPWSSVASVWRFDVPPEACDHELCARVDGEEGRFCEVPPSLHGGIANATVFKGNYDLLVHHALFHCRTHCIRDFLYYYNGRVAELDGFLERARVDERLRAAGARVYLFELDVPYWQGFEPGKPGRRC